MLAVAAALLVLPSAGFALEDVGKASSSLPTTPDFAAFTPASVDPKVARLVAERINGAGRLMRFTPAGVSDRPGRSVTVAIRLDDKAARAISVRSAITAAKEQVASSPAVQISPMRYNLGLSRDYQSFVQPAPLSKTLSQANVPDLSAFKPATVEEKPSRFAARVVLEEEAAPRTAPALDGVGTQSLDVAGSYRLTQNLDVTAGVRYSQDRDRIAPLVAAEPTDTQAVYIGTQFRF